MNPLTQEVFADQPPEVNWAGVDYDGLLNFGIATNQGITSASGQWRGFHRVGFSFKDSGFAIETSIFRNGIIVSRISSDILADVVFRNGTKLNSRLNTSAAIHENSNHVYLFNQKLYLVSSKNIGIDQVPIGITELTHD